MPWETPFVGRSEEVGLLQAELQRAAAGELRFVLLMADPGLGKSRLAQELLARNDKKVLALTARASPFGTTASFALWAEAVESHFRSLSRDDVASICGGYLDDLAGLLRSVAAIKGKAPRNDALRAQLLEGLAVIVGNLSRSRPLVIFLDDVHLADASSWHALDYLARNLPTARVLLVGAARPAELDQHQAAIEVLLTLEQEGQVRRIGLSPLQPDSLGELAEATIGMPAPLALVDWLTRKTRGNPLFALVLLRALAEEGADLTAPKLRSVPEGLSERVRRQLKAFDEPTIATLEVLAVLGSRVEISDLLQATGRPLEQLGKTLETLTRSRLVVDHERGPALDYEITHPLIQETIYDGIGSGRRRALHRSVGRALLSAGRLGAAAPHFARSADRADGEAIEALRDALRQTEQRGAYAEGLAILSALVQILPYGDQRWVEILDAMTMRGERVFRGGVEARMAVDALRAMDLVLVESPDPARRCAVKFRLASFLAWGTGELPEAQEYCRQALALCEETGDRLMALLAANELAYIQGLQGNIVALEEGAQAVALAAEKTGQRFATMQALGAVGMAGIFLGHFGAANAAIERSLTIAETFGEPHRVTFTASVLACSMALSGKVQDAVSAIEHAKLVNPAYSESMLPESEALIRWLEGNFGATVSVADAVTRRSQGGISRRRGWSLAFGALAATERSRVAEAQQFLKRGLAAYAGRPWLFFTDLFIWAYGVIAWRDGRYAEARALIGRAATLMQDKGIRPWASFPLADLAELGLEVRDPELVRSTADLLGELASAVDYPPYHGIAALAAGWSELTSGAEEAAGRRADEAFSLLAPTGLRAFVGRALELRGLALQHQDRPSAIDLLSRAAEAFRDCGATLRQRRVVERLRELGTRGRRAAGAALGPDALTSREREVVRLAAEGRTHREIGERLFIGQRTVETHLANAYAKLGIESKVDLMRRSAGLDL